MLAPGGLLAQEVAMPRRTRAPRRAGPLTPDDWRLLVRLPAEVMVTTINIQDDGPRRTVAEGLAGLDAIAAGRGSDSELVRAVVAAIYSEPEDERAGPAGDPPAQLAQVLGDCRRAAEVLRTRADPADAATYLDWVRQVAVRVCAAARSGGVLGFGGERIGAPEQEFLDDLAAALS
jgi:hypothetical protein